MTPNLGKRKPMQPTPKKHCSCWNCPHDWNFDHECPTPKPFIKETIKQLKAQRQSATNIGIDVDASIKAMQSTPKLGKWEEEFDEKFSDPNHYGEVYTYKSAIKDIKQFIQTQIALAKQQGYAEAIKEAVIGLEGKDFWGQFKTIKRKDLVGDSEWMYLKCLDYLLSKYKNLSRK